jgi:hypothetical protein
LQFSEYLSNGFDDLDYLFYNNSIQDLLKWSENIPIEFAYFLSGIEFRLNSNNEDLDFFFSLSRNGYKSKNFVESIANNQSFFESMGRSGEKIKGLLQKWTEGSFANLENIWFEFDSKSTNNSNSENIGSPSLFFGFGQREDSPRVAFIQNIINQFATESKPFSNLDDIFIKIDTHSLIFSHFGLMLSRETDSLRLFITNAQNANISKFLEKLKLDINFQAFEKLYNSLKIYFDAISIQLDVSPTGVGTKIGLECFLLNKPKHLYERQLELVEDFLVNQLDPAQ